MANPFEKDWTKPKGHELHEVGDSPVSGMADAMKDVDIPVMAHWHYAHPRLPVTSGGWGVSGYEYWRGHQKDIVEAAPPTINYPTMEQETHMRRLGVTDAEVLQCVFEKHGIHISNVGKEGGSSVKELRDEGLEILAQRFSERLLRSLKVWSNRSMIHRI